MDIVPLAASAPAAFSVAANLTRQIGDRAVSFLDTLAAAARRQGLATGWTGDGALSNSQPATGQSAPLGAPVPFGLALRDMGPSQPIGALAGSARQTLCLVRDRVLGTLRSASLEPSLPLRLRFGSDDTIAVVGDDPQGAAIERAIEQDPELVEMLRQLRAAQGRPSLDLTITRRAVPDARANTTWAWPPSGPQRQASATHCASC